LIHIRRILLFHNLFHIHYHIRLSRRSLSRLASLSQPLVLLHSWQAGLATRALSIHSRLSLQALKASCRLLTELAEQALQGQKTWRLMLLRRLVHMASADLAVTWFFVLNQA
jgi:hypothetical protein